MTDMASEVMSSPWTQGLFVTTVTVTTVTKQMVSNTNHLWRFYSIGG